MMRRGAGILAVLVMLGLAVPAGAQTRTLVAYAGSYSADTVYSLNDMVSLGGDFYISLAANNRGNPPVSSVAEWAPFASGGKGVGAVGATGANGVTGSAGATGPVGATGPMGATGLTGLVGPKGLDGPAGLQGAAGSKGLVGAAGAAGGMGAAGLQGATGANGGIGPAGATGATGAMGLIGVQGVGGPAGPAGPAGSTGVGTGSTAGEVRETRTFSVGFIKGYYMLGGNSLTLFSATGPGNVERIQIAASYSSDTPVPANTVLTIAVDGTTYRCTLGMFMLWNGYATSDGAAATSDLFVTKYLGITSATSMGNETISGYRRIYIKYNTSINISIATPAAAVNSGWWTQVEYYPGAAPAGRYAATRSVFHMATNDWKTIAAGQTVAVLPAVAGAGELESIYFVSSAPGKVEPQWLEQNPHIAVDGTDFHFGGTEDFFGNQFYGDQWRGRADEYGIARCYSSGAPDSTTYWSGYRYFKDSPMVFNSSLGMTWQNANADAGAAAKVGTLAVYYTTE